jgi:hypothetical protein
MVQWMKKQVFHVKYQPYYELELWLETFTDKEYI